MSNWIRFNQGNCPVCNGLRRDCRQSQETKLVHCLSTEANPTDWIYRGEDRLGFGMWANAEDTKAWKEKSREEQQQEQKKRKVQKAKQEKQKEEQNQRSLSDIERDAEIRKVLSQLTLSNRHRQLLKDRGLNDEQIKTGGYRSLKRWQKLKSSVSDQLAGIKLEGISIVNYRSGILCPIPNHKGLFVAWQIRQDGNSNNKYIWAASESDRKNKSTAHTKEFNELPLGIWQQPNEKGANRDVVGLTEGTGMKPYIASLKLNIPVIGASGGQFTSSPETLKASLMTIGAKNIVFYPDTGAILNQQVLKQYRKTFDLLQSWGYSIKVAWWEQWEKSDGDIDEISNEKIAEIKYLSVEEFKSKCREVARSSEKILEDKRRYWLKVNTPNLDEIGLEKKLEPGHIYVIKSAKGTGKTKTLKPIIKKFKNVYSWFNRIALGQEECEKLELDWKDDLKSFSGSLKVGFCANSADKFNPSMLRKNGLLIMDEADQVFNYLFEDICNKKGERTKILRAFDAQLGAAIAGNGIGIFLSADISNIEINHIKEIAPDGCEVRVIKNEYQPPRKIIKFDIGENPTGSIKDLLECLDNGIPCFVVDDTKKGKKGCKSVAEVVRQEMPEIADRIVEINADTTGTEEIQNYLKNINKASISKNTILLICSPSVVSGISIENGHFKKAYGIINGILTPTNITQALGRVRGLEDITLWVRKTGFNFKANRHETPEEIIKHYKNNYQASIKHLISLDADYNPMKDEWDSPWLRMYAQYAARQNRAMSELREATIQQFINEGCKIKEICYGLYPIVEERLKQASTKIKIEIAKQIHNAKLLSEEELSLLNNSNERLTTEQSNRKSKTILLKKYGEEIVDSTTYTVEATGEKCSGISLIDDDGRQYKKLKQLYFLLDTTDAAIKADRANEKRQEYYGGRFVADTTWNGRKMRLRQFLGLDKMIHGEWQESEAIEELGTKARQNSKHIKEVLGLSVKCLRDGEILRCLMRQIGLKVETQRVRIDGERVRIKRIYPESLKFAEMFLEHRAKVDNEEFNLDEIVKRYEQEEKDRTLFKEYDDDGQVIDIHTPEKYLSEECISEVAEMLSQIESKKGLEELRKVPEYTAELFNRAFLLSDKNNKEKIRKLNREIEMEMQGIHPIEIPF